KAGKNTADDYIEEWRREGRPCGPDLEQEAKAEAERLEAAYPEAVLDRLAAAGGIDVDRSHGPADDGSPSKEPA
ncbi:MAG TPA: virulence factor, partial [Candidatus Eisenbacteria bacterium]|nr:virulence factor [Candidatus Eisenbacteria bacterium]